MHSEILIPIDSDYLPFLKKLEQIHPATRRYLLEPFISRFNLYSQKSFKQAKPEKHYYPIKKGKTTVYLDEKAGRIFQFYLRFLVRFIFFEQIELLQAQKAKKITSILQKRLDRWQITYIDARELLQHYYKTKKSPNLWG